mgnify:FL=1|tara:strand:+ start:465 stop:1178 length:714 start_codon:yes stop_codon:yes gene_type:complete
MNKYKLNKIDQEVIDFTQNKLLPIANQVTRFYSHWTKSQEEKDLQKAFLYECRQHNIKLTREVAITQYYKDLAFTEKELDFFIFPEQNKFKLPTGIFIETKANFKDNTGQSELDGRYQLFRYMYSSSHNPDENLKNAEYAIFMNWGSDYDEGQFVNLEPLSIVENKVEAYIELWKAVDKEKTKFAKLYQSKIEPLKINKLKVATLKELCETEGLSFKSDAKKEELIKILNEAGIFNV